MKTEKVMKIDERHSIEWGKSTWDENEYSIRNRFNTEEGRFNKIASSEIPWFDFNLMILESIKRNRFSKEEICEISNQITEYFKKL